ncbi:MAG: hypothetical protein ACYCZY_10970 [Lacisediminihabitans sp.]
MQWGASLVLDTAIDLSTRMVVGWSMANHMRTSLIIDALTMVRDHGHLAAGGAIFHSDSENVMAGLTPTVDQSTHLVPQPRFKLPLID